MSGIRTPGVERIHDPARLAAEEELDRSLRPRRLEDFIGQDRVKDQLAVFIEAARALEETFYPAMEDHRLPITVGQGAGARVVTLDLPQFTLIGATTRTGLLTTPLRDRFGVTHRLDLYTPDELAQIVRRSAEVRHTGAIDEEVANEALEMLEVDDAGLDRLDREILRAICQNFGGG